MLCDQEVEDALPQQMYLEYFSPDYRLNYNRRPVSTGGGRVCGLRRVGGLGGGLQGRAGLAGSSSDWLPRCLPSPPHNPAS